MELPLPLCPFSESPIFSSLIHIAVVAMVLQWPSKMLQFPSLICPLPEDGQSVCLWPSSNPFLWSKMPLSLCFLHISVVALLFLSGNHFQATAAQDVSASRDQANPIATLYPNNATGVLNTTLAIIPIPLSTARQIIPPQYGILEAAYRALLPHFPKDMYPVLVQAAHDHDIRFQDFGIPDFSVSFPIQIRKRRETLRLGEYRESATSSLS
jgi:hypothetical protein